MEDLLFIAITWQWEGDGGASSRILEYTLHSWTYINYLHQQGTLVLPHVIAHIIKLGIRCERQKIA